MGRRSGLGWWEGITKSTSLSDNEARRRIELFQQAKSGQWADVLEIISRYDPYCRIVEPDEPSFNTLLHYAAQTNADIGVIQHLIEHESSRIRRNAKGHTALNIAEDQGYEHLYSILQPVVKHDVPSDVLQKLEQNFYVVLREWLDRPRIAKHALQLPQLDILLEMEIPAAYFLVTGMYGGFDYKLERRNDEFILTSYSMCRVVEGSDRWHLITTRGSYLEKRSYGHFEVQAAQKKIIITRIYTMKAAILAAHGGLDQVQYTDALSMPEPQTGEVRVQMKAAALNRLDLFVRAGWKGLNLHFPHVIGSDGAGVIEAVGAGVTHVAAGDPVAIDPMFITDEQSIFHVDYENQGRIAIGGEHRSGFAAEYVVVPARNVVKMPAGFSFHEAAAAGLVFVTAWHSLITKGRVRAGERMLIVGAGGGVNSASLQIAKLAGAHVIVVGSNAAKCEQARALGADATINREETPDWAKEVAALTQKRGVDLVVDNVGAATLNSSIRACRVGGRILIVGGTSGYDAQINVAQIFARQISLIGSTMGTHADYVTVMNLLFAGKLKAVIGQVFPLDQAREAQAALEKGEQFGKIVIEIN